MKNKKHPNKLEFKKATVVNLTELQMQAVQGGEYFTSVGPNHCYTQCYTTDCCPAQLTQFPCPDTGLI